MRSQTTHTGKRSRGLFCSAAVDTREIGVQRFIHLFAVSPDAMRHLSPTGAPRHYFIHPYFRAEASFHHSTDLCNAPFHVPYSSTLPAHGSQRDPGFAGTVLAARFGTAGERECGDASRAI